jgi:hypothetical protein
VVLPLGVPQFAQRRPAAGLVYGSLQAGFGIVSIAMHARLNRGNVAAGPDHPFGWTSEEVRSEVSLERYLYQWPATAGFYITWGVSALDAARWHKRHPPASVGLGRSEGGAPLLVLGGTF